MDILYIIGPKSKTNHFELRCSLRSIEKFGKNVGNVYVVGYCPRWLSDEVIKLPCEDKYKSDDITQFQKNANICYKLLYAVDHSDIGETFMVSMDDHFYVKETDFENYPYFVRNRKNYGIELPDSSPGTPYLTFLSSVREYIKGKKLPILNFGLHRNRRVTREDIEACREVLGETINNCIPSGGLIYLSNYRYSKDPFCYKIVKDVKISNREQEHLIGDSEVFSTTDFYPFTGLYFLLRKLYPDQSKYEKKNCLTLL